MSQSVINTIADAVVAELNDAARTWAGQFTAQRLFLPIFDLAVLAQLQVVAVPRSRPTNDKFTRGAVGTRGYKRRQVHRIDLFVEQKPPDTTNATLDPLQLLTEQIESWFLNDEHTLATYVNARAIESMIDPYPSLADLDEDGVYLAIVQMQFEVLI